MNIPILAAELTRLSPAFAMDPINAPQVIENLLREAMKDGPELEQLKRQNQAMREALKKCQRTFETLEQLGGYSTSVPPNIVLQSCIAIAEATKPTAGSDLVTREEHERAVEGARAMTALNLFGPEIDQLRAKVDSSTLFREQLAALMGVSNDPRYAKDGDAFLLRAVQGLKERGNRAIDEVHELDERHQRGIKERDQLRSAVDQLRAQLTAATQRAEKAEATCLELTTCDDALSLAEDLAKISIENRQLRADKDKAESERNHYKRQFDAHVHTQTCANCGEMKPLPYRRDDLGGYVCLTCVEQYLNRTLDDKEKAEKACAEKQRALDMVHNCELPLETWQAIDRASSTDCGKNCVSKEAK